MYTLQYAPAVPVHSFRREAGAGNNFFSMTRSEGGVVYEADLLKPHRKNFYLMVFVKHNVGRHWVDTIPYEHAPNTFYFSTPRQVLVKEDPSPFWGTHFSFTPEFLALQQNTALLELPLVQNPHNGHELQLTVTDAAFVEETLSRIEAEYARPGEWQHRMLSAHVAVLLTYLSRLYTEQFAAAEPSADKFLLKTYQVKIEECYRELHEVGAYAALLNISAGHLSEVVKAQSGKSAIKHIHERLVLEARRLLFYSHHSLKEIAFDLGFANASYFNRFFKRETGATPAEYRTTIRKMYQ
ncbi:AraC family transcriptional regulator [Hymenobacter metallilatus]|uniref:AraC family transcriptional regulator n=1 Tax=Hymenobacter metallilatus TaxID=2493666 RepID=A0A3R9NFF0_9BACT|nr:helix-turn-helix transcriptional regulator [Hymenobacter metallilatus]RSK33072.1 AraC family transcriptional regulator [Hymenobacter metallilatus]